MEVDLSDILNVRTIKMESSENAFDGCSEAVEMSDPLSVIPQYVTEADLGLMQTGSEILQGPLAVFSDTADEDDTMQSTDSSEEVIVHLMDIRTKLSKLRTMLEKRLAIDLSDYTFWLQDAKMLESHKTLVEQCIRGSGIVQVNVQVRAAERKINILDVLKPDEELAAAQNYLNLEDSIEPEHPPPLLEVEKVVKPEKVEKVVKAPEKRVATGAVRWVVATQFRKHCSENSRARLPDDPGMWSIQHVKLWIQWAVRQFNLSRVKLSHWNINGSQLCALTNAEFKEKVPSDPGDIFWTHFELLRKCKFIAVVQTEESGPPPPSAKYPVEIPQSAIKKKPKPMMTQTPGLDPETTPLPRNGNNGQPQLWQFLLELLTSAEHCDVIRWHGTEGEFKLVEPERVARLWGLRKHKPAMNYEKLSRALRYYYDGDMIAKVPGKRFVYKFVCDLQQLIGYGPAKLAQLVEEVYEVKYNKKLDEKYTCAQKVEKHTYIQKITPDKPMTFKY